MRAPMVNNLVIGSGPAGVACAMALTRRGRSVTMIDGGGTLEADKRAALERLRSADPQSWRGEAVAFLRHQSTPDRKGLGTKRVYGSDYPYRDSDRILGLERSDCDLTASLASGGFSAVWGATVLPYLAADTADWPFPIGRLAPHYQAVLSFMDVSMCEDDLAELFPMPPGRGGALRPSRQAEALLADMGRHRDGLARDGIRFGRSRLAVRAESAPGSPGCAYCGLCMYGCPYGLIYSSEATLEAMAAGPGFRRLSGVIVDRLSEGPGDKVTIFGRRREGLDPVRFEVDRVYLAAGAVGSTRILLRSLEAYDRPVSLKDSQYFLFPLLRFRAHSGTESEALHTLSQVFIEVRDPAVSDRTIHLQVYTYNELYEQAIRKSCGPAGRLLQPLIGGVSRRMLVVQGYLHSDHSVTIRATLRRGPAGEDRLQLDGRPDGRADAEATLKRLLRRLSSHWRGIRALPLGFLLHRAAPGRGFHSGGTFPMRREPGEFESDLLGRPRGFRRVHVVDATVFPSIPATTITYSVMANAHRIAVESDGE